MRVPLIVATLSVRLLLPLPAGAAEMPPLAIGTGRADLTPPLELKAALGGYGERQSRPATGVHDRVWAKALVLRAGNQAQAVVTADVLAFPPGFRDAVAAALQAEGWTADQILLLPSHTHTSIDMTALNPRNTFQIPQLGLFHAALYERTIRGIADAIRAASRQPLPARVGSATVRLDQWNRNRRHGGAVDRELTLTRIDAEAGQPLAVLVNWTAHPTFMDAEHLEFSGDWPGHLQRTLEALIGQGVTVLYFNGAEGDQSPTPRVEAAPAWEQAERYGRELALEAWRLWERTRPAPAPTFQRVIGRLSLPPRRAHPDFLQTGGAEYGLTADNVDALLSALCPAETHCSALRLGDLWLVAVPGELAAELGLQIKAAARRAGADRAVAIGGLADEWVSYFLTPEEYRRGGYEASVSFYGERAGPEIVRAAVALLGELR